MNLPAELHLLVAHNLELTTLVSLKLTSRFFYKLIAPPTRSQLAKGPRILINRIGHLQLACRHCLVYDSASGKAFQRPAGRCVRCGIPNQSWLFTRLKYLGGVEKPLRSESPVISGDGYSLQDSDDSWDEVPYD